jgi:hypothetical protein
MGVEFMERENQPTIIGLGRKSHPELKALTHKLFKNCKCYLVPKCKLLAGHIVHACNPSYKGGRDSEDHCSRPDRAK